MNQNRQYKEPIFSPAHTPDQSMLRDYQLECIEKIENAGPGSYLIVLPTGSGKCFAPGTEILMYDGSIRKVETIKEGEQVMGPDSNPRTVVGLSHGREMMYKITPSKGDFYIVNESHILSLKATGNKSCILDNNGNRYYPGDICNISVRDYLETSKTFKHCMKGYRTGVEFEEKPLECDPYIFGIWLGDGTSRCSNITIANKDVEIIESINDFCKRNNLILKVKDFNKEESAKLYKISTQNHRWNENPLNHVLNKYKIRNNKQIPSHYLCNSRKNRLELLAGILDTDGYLGTGCFEICQKNQILAEQICYLARSLGFNASKNKKIINNVEYTRINISGDVSQIPCRLKRKQASPRCQKKDVLVTGIKVESVGIGEYYGFELLGPDRLFLLSDFTVVHNTYVFSHIPRHGRVLILSHRDELVHQPEKYFDCSYGVEQAKEHSNGEEVVSASVQSLVRRLKRFDPYDFDMIITDEAHHATAPSYKKIYEYFKPRVHIGFTATPDRADKDDLNKIFDEVLFYRDIRWGIQNGYLTDIDCMRVDVGYDISHVHKNKTDFLEDELGKEMLKPACVDAVAEAYHKYHKGQTVIFCVNVEHCHRISAKIPGSVVVTGETKNRHEIIERFTNKEFECLINCMVFTEGTDMPLIETVIMARPTRNQSLYVQCVGRGLRPYPGKEALNLIDCVGVSKMSVCSAPSLFGLNIETIPKKKRGKVKGRLTKMEATFDQILDAPDSWINTVERITFFEKENGVHTDNLNCIPMGDDSLHIPIGKNMTVIIPPTNALGKTTAYIQKVENQKTVRSKSMKENDLQSILNDVYAYLMKNHQDSRILWDAHLARDSWGSEAASLSQLEYITNLATRTGVSLKEIDPSILTKHQASVMIEQLKTKPIINPNAKRISANKIKEIVETARKKREWELMKCRLPYKVQDEVLHPFKGAGKVIDIKSNQEASDFIITVQFESENDIAQYSYKEIGADLKRRG